MVYSGYRKQQPMFDCGLSWSDWSKEHGQSYNRCSSWIHITYCSVWGFFVLRLSEILLIASMWILYIVLRFLCRYIFLVWLLLFVMDFLLHDLSNCWFFQARLLVLLWWSILYEMAEVIYMFEYFLCMFPNIFNSRINSYVILCSSLFLSLIHLALLYITLYWLCVLVQIVSTF